MMNDYLGLIGRYGNFEQQGNLRQENIPSQTSLQSYGGHHPIN